jgi:hypothetical protein
MMRKLGIKLKKAFASWHGQCQTPNTRVLVKKKAACLKQWFRM